MMTSFAASVKHYLAIVRATALEAYEPLYSEYPRASMGALLGLFLILAVCIAYVCAPKSEREEIKSELKENIQKRFPAVVSLANLNKSTLTKALGKIQERRKFRAVTKRAKIGQGLESLFTEVSKPSAVLSFNESSSSSSSNSRNDVSEAKNLLKKADAFSWLPDALLQTLVDRCCEFLELEKFDVLTRSGELSRTPSIFIVASGSVSLRISADADEESFEKSCGELVNGLSDVLACVAHVPLSACATVSATSENCRVLKVSRLNSIFEDVPGLREDFIQRTLLKFQRVTFTALFRLSGMYFFDERRNNNAIGEPSSISDLEDFETLVRAVRRVMMTEFFPEREAADDGEDPLSGLVVKRVKSSSEEELDAFEESNLTPKLVCEALCFEQDQVIDLRKAGPCVYFVLSGSVRLTVSESQTVVRSSGFVFGHLSVLTSTWTDWYGDRLSVLADSDCVLARMSEDSYFHLVESRPDIVVSKAKSFLRSAGDLVRWMDVTTTYRKMTPGMVLVHAGSEYEHLYVVLNGRMRATRSGKAFGEYGRGSAIGEFSFLASSKAVATVSAVRNTQLAVIRKLMVSVLASKHPRTTSHVSKLLSRSVRWMLERGDEGLTDEPATRTVALVPASSSVPLQLFGHTLVRACEAMGLVVDLFTSEHMRRVVSDDSSLTSESFEEQLVLAWLNEAEDSNDVLFLKVDPHIAEDASSWSKLCVQQADVVLLIGDVNDPPHRSKLEQKLDDVKVNARRELVLLDTTPDDDDSFDPHSVAQKRNTRGWILNRKRIQRHHQVRIHPENPFRDVFFFKSDFRRLARFLTGNAIGLVLGGGGARGLAHLGLLEVLDKNCIPIDVVGGTSIGSFVGGLYALHGADVECESYKSFTLNFCSEMSSLRRKIQDVTFPLVSYLSGDQFNRTIVRVFGDTFIEDFGRSFFCNTCDLTASREIIHRNGFAWKYIRASMSLTGYLPPMCDDGADGKTHYLCDGGYLNTLPATKLRELVGPRGTAFSCDVSGDWAYEGDDYGASLSGMWYLYKWLAPWERTPKIPTASDIAAQLSFLSSANDAERNKLAKLDISFEPNVNEYSTLQFHLLEEIKHKGLEEAQLKVSAWKKKLVLEKDPRLMMFGESTKPIAVSTNVASNASSPAKSTQSSLGLKRSNSSFGATRTPRASWLHDKTRQRLNSWAHLESLSNSL